MLVVLVIVSVKGGGGERDFTEVSRLTLPLSAKPDRLGPGKKII